MKILGISGSLRSDSHNSRLLRAAAEALPPETELELFEQLEAIPPYNEDRESQAGEAVEALRAAIAGVDAVLIATPEYNNSLPGQLKNALDWVSRPIDRNPMQGKPAAVIGASTGMFGAVWAQAEGRKVLARLGARVVDEELPVARADVAFEGTRLADPQLGEQLTLILARLMDEVRDRAQLAAA